MRVLVSGMENLIESGRYQWAAERILSATYSASSLIKARELKRLASKGLLLQARQQKDGEKAGRLIQRFAKHGEISWSMLRDYISIGEFQSAHLIASALPSPELRGILNAAVLRADGKLDAALEELLPLKPTGFQLKFYVTGMVRNLYHQKRDHGMLAATLIEFLESEPKRIFIKQAYSAAAAAEAAGREDLFSLAITRMLDDIDTVMKRRSLFRSHWREALEGAISLFDIEGAVRIAQRAKALRYRSGNAVQNALALKDDIASIAHVVEEARRDILERSGARKPVARDGSVIVVMPAAAVRSNRIDYPGFRADIRNCVRYIVETLEADRVPYVVKSRVKTHGNLQMDRPYFSYHTISEDGIGLHFKETDRRSLFSFDQQGYAGWSKFGHLSKNEMQLDAVDGATASSFFNTDREAMIATRGTKYEQNDIVEKLPEKYIFVGLQVIGDAVQSLAYASPFDMLDEVVSTAKALNLQVVVKRHPSCRAPQIAKYLADHAADLVLSTGNIHDIIPRAEAVCVINSGVGAESLIYEKPVYVFGKSDYMGACFVCEHPGDFQRLFRIGARRLELPDLHKFWYLYRNVYACNLRDDDTAKVWIADRVRRHLRETAHLAQDHRLN